MHALELEGIDKEILEEKRKKLSEKILKEVDKKMLEKDVGKKTLDFWRFISEEIQDVFLVLSSACLYPKPTSWIHQNNMLLLLHRQGEDIQLLSS